MAAPRKKRRAPSPEAEVIELAAPAPAEPPEPANDDEKTRKGEDLDAIHATALKRYARAEEAERENVQSAYEALTFLSVEGAQWDAAAKAARLDRPCLEFNRLPATVAQVTGDIRQMRPAVKVAPVNDAAAGAVADILAGMVRYIENRSDASAAYFAAADSQVAAGIGHWQVVREYADDSTFEQELRVTGIDDQVAVYWDPGAKLPTREDAKFCFVPVDMPREDFEEQFPDATASSLESLSDVPEAWRATSSDDVRLATYWLKRPVKKTLALLPDGGIEDVTTDAGLRADAEAQGARIEQRDGHEVVRYLMTGAEIVEGPVVWPGRFIPIVRVVGVETKIGKKTVRRGIVQLAKDAQRSYNYARSTQTEVVALQPKAPFIGTEDMFKGYETVWETANTVNHPFLPYNLDTKAPQAKPERVQPPVPSSGLAELTREAGEDIKAVTGIYDASLGAQGNETSGKAITARQREGDTGTFVYIDNFARAVRHSAQILVDLIPEVYDTARTIRIAGEDGKVDVMKINQAAPGPLVDGAPMNGVLNDVTIGAYDVQMEMGPSYTTRREEARDGMKEIIAGNPDALTVLGGLYAKACDFPMADKIAERLDAIAPPPIQALIAKDKGEPPPPPPPPSPQQMAEMQAQQRQQELDGQRHEIEIGKLGLERDRIGAELQKAASEIEKARLEAATKAHEATVGAASAASAATAPAADPRVDHLVAAVQSLDQVLAAVAQAVQAMQGGGAPPPPPQDAPPDPGGPPGLPAPPAPPGPPDAPSGGLSFDPSAASPAAPMMG